VYTNLLWQFDLTETRWSVLAPKIGVETKGQAFGTKTVLDIKARYGRLPPLQPVDAILRSWRTKRKGGVNAADAAASTTAEVGMEDASTNHRSIPGGRFNAVGWTNRHSIWVFGGHGYDEGGKLAHLNDLWSFRYAYEVGETGGGQGSSSRGVSSKLGSATSAATATSTASSAPFGLGPFALEALGLATVGAIALVVYALPRSSARSSGTFLADSSAADGGGTEEVHSLLAGNKDGTAESLRVDTVGDGITPYTVAPDQ
jgi:hypothetical protein